MPAVWNINIYLYSTSKLSETDEMRLYWIHNYLQLQPADFLAKLAIISSNMLPCYNIIILPSMSGVQPSPSCRMRASSSKTWSSATSTGPVRVVRPGGPSVLTAWCSTLTSLMARIPVISGTTFRTSVRAETTSRDPSLVSDIVYTGHDYFVWDITSDIYVPPRDLSKLGVQLTL